MKIIHLSDLHIGKRFHEMSLAEDQDFIFGEILKIIDSEVPDCIVIAGDVYDKSTPSAEAVSLFDSFITALAEREKPVMIISGNHDSAERIAFGSHIMEKQNMFFSPVYDGHTMKVTLSDDIGDVDFYLLPFIRPSQARQFFPDREINDYTDAVAAAIDAMDIDPEKRNVMITHQFVTGAQSSGSEDCDYIAVGGLDHVSASVFEKFDYTALGHIHRPQNIGSEKIRYSGTPLKYSFDEEKQTKSVTVAELRRKGELTVHTVDLRPLRETVCLRGTFDEIFALPPSDDFVKITLTDKNEIIEARGTLQRRFNKLLKFEYESSDINFTDFTEKIKNNENRSPLELFGEFYSARTGNSLSDEQNEYISGIIENIWGK